MTATTARPAVTGAEIMAGRRARQRRRLVVTVVIAAIVVATYLVTLMVGNTFYGLDKVIRVILGETVPGASFTVGELRLPRVTQALLTGLAFGMAGVTFQTMLRNPLASPDIIGVTWGASAAAVVGIIILGVSETIVSLMALAAALLTALLLFALSNRGGFAGARLILMGIGIAAVLDSIVSYVLSRAAAWDMQTAMQWLIGSVNNASWDRVWPLALASLVLVPVLVLRSKDLDTLRLGDDSAAALGVRVRLTRFTLILAAVMLLAFATAASGPVAFVAFMAGPIAARLVGPGASLLVPAGLVGAALVMLSDLIGQFAFERYPVGVITGILGAPYLIYLLIRTNRSGGSL